MSPSTARVVTIPRPSASGRRRRWVSLIGVLALLVVGGATVASVADAVSPRPYSIWGNTQPLTTADSDTQSVELGMKFVSSADGWVSAVRFYKSPQNTGHHTGTLWDSRGVALAQTVFTNESRSGWQEAQLPQPVRVHAGQTYTASYWAPNGHYADDVHSLSSKRQTVKRDLTATSGVFTYAPQRYPTSVWNDSNYYVDVLFSRSTGVTQPPPTSPTTSAPTTSAPTTTTTSAPSPTTTPPSSGTCVSRPSVCGYPDASNTGVTPGTRLTPSGCISANTPGQVIENLIITDCTIDVYAPNVTIRNVKIVSAAVEMWALRVSGSGSATISNVDISGHDKGGRSVQYAILNQSDKTVTIDRANISMCHNCVQGESIVMTNSYIHDMAMPPGAHVDGFLCIASCGVTLTHNTILNEWPQTSAIALFGDFGTPVNSVISNNLIAGGGYTIYGGTSRSTGIRITGNRFSTLYHPDSGYFGSATAFNPAGSGNVWSGNYFDGSGKPAGY